VGLGSDHMREQTVALDLEHMRGLAEIHGNPNFRPCSWKSDLLTEDCRRFGDGTLLVENLSITNANARFPLSRFIQEANGHVALHKAQSMIGAGVEGPASATHSKR
jgi:hypothetical protein